MFDPEFDGALFSPAWKDAVAIDRTSKFAFIEFHQKVTPPGGRGLPAPPIAAVPYKVHTVLTDNGTHFTDAARRSLGGRRNQGELAAGSSSGRTPSNSPAPKTMIDHRLTKPKHPLDQRSGRANEPHHQGRHCEQVELALLGPDLGDVDMEVADRVALYPSTSGPADTLTLKAAMQG